MKINYASPYSIFWYYLIDSMGSSVKNQIKGSFIHLIDKVSDYGVPRLIASCQDGGGLCAVV
jgi:hypothetical protein